MLNTALIPSLPIFAVANIAEYHAKAALRAGRHHDDYGFAVSVNKMYDVLEAAKYPQLTTEELVRHIGRGKAMVLGVERRLINLAL